MDKPKRRALPFLPIAIVVAVVFLSLLLLILDRVEDPDRQQTLIWRLIALFVGGLAAFTWVSVQWRRRRREDRSGRFSDGSAGRVFTEMFFTGNPWVDTSTYRRPRRIKLDRKERKAWAEAGRRTGLELDRSRNPRLVGALRGIEVRVDPAGPGGNETRARAALPISLDGQVIADLSDDGAVRIEGASTTLEAALRDSPVIDWLTAAGDATLEIENQGARAFAPEIGADADALHGLIELAVSAAEAVTAWANRN